MKPEYMLLLGALFTLGLGVVCLYMAGLTGYGRPIEDVENEPSTDT